MPPATINSSIDAQGKCQLLSWRFEACRNLTVQVELKTDVAMGNRLGHLFDFKCLHGDIARLESGMAVEEQSLGEVGVEALDGWILVEQAQLSR